MQKVLQDFILEYKPKIDAEIEQELERRLAEVRMISPHLVSIVEAMQELGKAGKRLRGLLTLLGYEISGKEVDEEIIKAAVVMEIFHLGLLIQDDFMDRDDLRRGVSTIHTRYNDSHTGNFVAMLSGDYTFGWGMEIMANLQLPSNNVNQGMRVWGGYFTRVGYGQTLDGLAVADDKTLLQILELKSGEYTCVLPLVLGATLAGASGKVVDTLKSFGLELGWVFQLRDDWLGEYGVTTKTGKPVGNDSREGKRTYATMYGQEKTEDGIREHMTLAKKWGLSLPAQAGLRGDSSQGRILLELVDWMGTREN